MSRIGSDPENGKLIKDTAEFINLNIKEIIKKDKEASREEKLGKKTISSNGFVSKILE